MTEEKIRSDPPRCKAGRQMRLILAFWGDHANTPVQREEKKRQRNRKAGASLRIDSVSREPHSISVSHPGTYLRPRSPVQQQGQKPINS
jgi:hypothetical protein